MRDSDPPSDDSEIDPISALFSAPDHATRQALLPDAVAQAGQMAGKMRALITTWSTTTDPDIAELVEQARGSVGMRGFRRRLARLMLGRSALASPTGGPSRPRRTPGRTPSG